LIERKALKYLSELPEKSQRLIKEKCHALSDDPYPGQGGDKELLHLDYKLYRLHIGRSFTVFYQICEEDGQVKILEITTIERAHKLYRRLEE
jgi:mRNA interferase RelE/StbE